MYADNKPVGYVESYDAYGPSWKIPLDNLPKPLTTFEICVWEEEYLGEGISDQILQLLFSKDVLGSKNLLLCTDTENIKALKLLESCDFKITSTNPDTGELRMLRLAST